MPSARPLKHLTLPERLNFLLTNRLPRRWLTLLLGRFSRIRHPIIKHLSIRTWQLFVDDLRLHEAKKQRFDSLHDCFIRELQEGARPFDSDPATLASPCDAVVGEFGAADGVSVIQAKGFPYELNELLGSDTAAAEYRNARFLTLRLKSSMYHRFHAPQHGQVGTIRYISGDTWNVNPIALKVVERLFLKNERVVIPLQLADGNTVTLVAIAAILVASLRLHGLDYPLNLEYTGPNDIEIKKRYAKGEQMGYFEHGSTIVLLAPRHYEFVDGMSTGTVVRAGQAILRRTTSTRNTNVA
ncbi:MAG: archaetidylserine decarboxylase [Pseudomonadota bacterium]